MTDKKKIERIYLEMEDLTMFISGNKYTKFTGNFSVFNDENFNKLKSEMRRQPPHKMKFYVEIED